MKDADFEIKFYENILRRNPNFVEALTALGDLYTKAGRYEDGLKVDQKLALLQPDDPLVFYNLACSYSLLRQIGNAFDAIKKAIDAGYDNLGYLEKDTDLDNLRHDGKFQKYFELLKERKR